MMQISKLCVDINGKQIIDNISTNFPFGLNCIVGANGCGKTTLLSAIEGLITSSGSISWQGQNIADWSRNARARKMAYLPQGRNLPQIEGKLLIAHGRFPYGGLTRRLSTEDQRIIEQAIADTHIEAFVEKKLPEMSGGERQKVYIAAALAQQTEILLLDEPTTYLDLRCQQEIMELLKTLASRGKCIIAVLHDIVQAFSYADNLCVMAEGRVVLSGTPQNLYADPLIQAALGVRLATEEDDNALMRYKLIK